MKTTLFAVAAATCLFGASAFATPALDLQSDQFASHGPALGQRDDLMRQWAGVGRCVVGHDRTTSVAFVRAPAGSDDASAAARRLDPVFASCLAGSRVPGPSSVVLRRAAVAKALGFAATSI
ncbi:MAG: hypothetical protein J0I47_08020 [Sphingomonas sp.]|uniref:hypothetical protein n=1 Tax=Sphingomonas sp. TaxID=28214 RepID=UPI001AC3E14C|nr:hypothetical protein [Sphingomonas sp.]MBN8808168.1 hypothetical protein [Sphingomonas sp.]